MASSDSLDFEQIEARDDQWISAADLLGGALIIFLLLIVYFMLTVGADNEKLRDEKQGLINNAAAASVRENARYEQTVARLEEELQRVQRRAVLSPDSVKEVAITYDKKRSEIYEALVEQFSGDLPRWNAEIDKDLTVRFNEPSVLFAVGSSDIRDRFKNILNDFFPRYLEIVTGEDFQDAISEIRIEGHTSSFWNLGGNTPEQVAYLKNMDLSYERSRSVLRYVMGLDSIDSRLPFLRKHLTANGLSSSKLIYNADGNEDHARSQRVEFRVRTDVESKIAKILEEAPEE